MLCTLYILYKLHCHCRSLNQHDPLFISTADEMDDVLDSVCPVLVS